MIEEIWKDIPGYYQYQVSNKGNVRSMMFGKIRILKKSRHTSGYLKVGINSYSKNNTPLVHRLVGLSFLDGIEGKEEINHKNGIKTDNRIENLEWCTRSENLSHSINILGNNTLFSCASVRVKQFSILGEFIKEFESISQAAKYLGLRKQNIYACCKMKIKTTGGYIWRYS